MIPHVLGPGATAPGVLECRTRAGGGLRQSSRLRQYSPRSRPGGKRGALYNVGWLVEAMHMHMHVHDP